MKPATTKHAATAPVDKLAHLPPPALISRQLGTKKPKAKKPRALNIICPKCGHKIA